MKMPKEIERRFLVKNKSVIKGLSGVYISQGYIPGSMTTRVRLCEKMSYLTLKGPKIAAVCDEFEYPIPVSDAVALLKYCTSRINKTRYRYPYMDGLVFEIDEFEGLLSGLVIAEVEFPTENTYIGLPDFLGREITEDHRYSNIALSKYDGTEHLEM
jgi:CYTH domain-containing protein